jgi:uncharacterized protein YlxW (UPF0749 family)
MNVIRSRSWVLKVTIMSIGLGMLIAVSLKTQQQMRSEGIGDFRWPELVMAYKDARRQNERLHKQIAQLQDKLTDYEYQISQGSSSAKLLNRELQEIKFLAGLTAAHGPGVTVTLKDSRKKTGPGAIPIIDSLIHDTDIWRVVNELSSAGAEAISINDQRVIAMTPIRCVGPVIQVNEVPIAQPYVIRAIGNPKTLESALRMTGGVVDSMPDPDMIEIKQETDITVPAYAGSRRTNYLKPAG